MAKNWERRREYTKKERDNDTLRILMSSRFNRTLSDKCNWFACRGNANKYLAITRWLVRFPTPTYIRSWCLCVVTRLLDSFFGVYPIITCLRINFSSFFLHLFCGSCRLMSPSSSRNLSPVWWSTCGWVGLSLASSLDSCFSRYIVFCATARWPLS